MTILYGGSFDPIHDGHLHFIRQLLALFSPDKFYVVPAKRNPLKNETFAPAKDRLEMLQRALDSFNDERVKVLDWELKRAEPSYTLLTVESLLKKGETDLTIAMGNEVFASLPSWHEPRKLLESVNLIVVMREESQDFDPTPVLEEVGICDLSRDKNGWRHSGGSRWIRRESIQALEVSSTRLRREIGQRWKSGVFEPMPQGIQRSVWQYIKENRLYAVS